MMNKALTLIRVFHNLKQKDLAESLGVSPSFLSEIESGKKQPTVDMLQKYADHFRIPVSSLVYFSEQMDKGGQRANNPIAAKALRMLEWLDTITRDEEDHSEEQVSA
ncbi:MAG TPA: helix-turn-helix transcriptional regulator [Verrucomicrobiae bacterium]|nr:helix-turn-helix transcriptional regulator [Verrucomicrobiae bacterium]